MRPFVRLCMAMSLDGKIASVDGSGAKFSSPADKERLLALRTEADAILVGARTIAVDDDRMRVWRAEAQQRRIAQGRPPHPLCAIVSGRGNVPLDAAVFHQPDVPVVIFGTEQMPLTTRRALESQARVHLVGEREVDPHAILTLLAETYRVAHLLLEGGGELNFAFFREDLIDELHLTLCPVILGGREAPTLVGGAGFPLSDLRRYRLTACRRVGEELFLQYARPE